MPHTKYDNFVNGLITSGDKVTASWVDTKLGISMAAEYDERTSTVDQIISKIASDANSMLASVEAFIRELTKYNRVHYESSDID
jgi:hypothetical protein